MKKVIHIYGASGSGTTSLGVKISKELGFSHLDSDDYYWYPTDPPFTSKRNREDRLSLLLKDIENTDEMKFAKMIQFENMNPRQKARNKGF